MAQSGSFVNIITNEAKLSFVLVCIRLCRSIGLIIILSTFLILTSPLLTALAIFSFVIVAFMYRGVAEASANASKAMIASNSDFSQALVQRLKAVKQIKVDQVEIFESQKIGAVLERQAAASKRVGFLTAITETTVEPVILATALCVLGLVSFFYDIELALLGFFIILTARMMPLFKQTLTSWQRWTIIRESLQTVVNEIEKMRASQESDSGLKKLDGEVIERIRLENVHYSFKNNRYPSKEALVEESSKTVANINLELARGEIIGLIGPSGSGKSTLIDLLLGLREPDQGLVLVNEKPLTHYSQKEYRSRIGQLVKHPHFLRELSEII